MLDLIALQKTQLADIVRNLQELRGESISASSSLLRVKSEVLAEWIGRLAEDRWVIAADGTVQPAVVAPEPAEPQETPPEPPAPEPDAKPDYRPEPAAEVQDLPSASEPAGRVGPRPASRPQVENSSPRNSRQIVRSAFHDGWAFGGESDGETQPMETPASPNVQCPDCRSEPLHIGCTRRCRQSSLRPPGMVGMIPTIPLTEIVASHRAECAVVTRWV